MNNNSLDRHPLFSQKCWSFPLPRHEEYKKLINQILLIDSLHPEQVLHNPHQKRDHFLRDKQQSYVYAWKSDWRLHENFPILTQLTEEIKPYFNTIIEEEKLKDSTEIEVTDCWINQYGKDDYALPHVHDADQWIAVYMMNIPKDSNSVFRIFNPLGITYNSELNENKAALDVNPIEGTVLLCPGAICHEVTPNESEEKRVTVITNFRLFTKFGGLKEKE
jgi:uncharacterized protein (TIGR02466 family)|tara:strand:- start:259 stop:918 length:660 start_codon:yes stop_codon:yes gene_type:complete